MNYSDVDYFVLNEYDSFYVISENKIKIESNKIFLNELLGTYFLDFAAYKKILRKNLGISRKASLYLKKDLLFMRVDSNKGVYYINYYNVFKMDFCDEQLLVIFNDKTKIAIDTTSCSWKNSMKKFKKLLDYIKNI